MVVAPRRQRFVGAKWSAIATDTVLSPLATFNAKVDKRRHAADRIPLDAGGCAGPIDAVPIISFLDLMSLAFAGATSAKQVTKRQEFARQVKNAGGFCLVKLEDIEASILDGMWGCMDALFDGNNMNTDSNQFRRQTLTTGNVDEQCHHSGYEFVQTTLLGNQVRPRSLVDLVGESGADQAKKVYQLLSQMAKAFSSVVYAGASDVSPKEASDLISSLVDDEHQSFSGSYHRMCRYLRVKGDGWGESMRSHVDWTLSTPIPVSNVAGLEIFHPQTSEWIRPELTSRQLFERDGAVHEGRWNSAYVVVMTGAWLEILTNGEIESTIHRVVSDAKAESRKSAPFFMRPREAIFERVDAIFDNVDATIMAMDASEATESICSFLSEGLFVAEVV